MRVAYSWWSQPFTTKNAMNVLVIDDCPIDRRFAEQAIQSLVPDRVYTADNGVEALNMLNMVDFDLIVTDWMMPQMNGLEFVQKAREREITTPIVMLTSRSDIDDVRQGSEAGATAFLMKPISRPALVRAIESVCPARR